MNNQPTRGWKDPKPAYTPSAKMWMLNIILSLMLVAPFIYVLSR